MKILATLPDNMLNLSVHEMMEATRDYGKSICGNDFCMDISMNPFWEIENPDYDLIHIHWPEALFNWIEVSKEDLIKLETRLLQLKDQGKKIVVTRHNSIPHRRAENDKKLYELSFRFADAVFHMEQFCREEYDEFYGSYLWSQAQKHFFAPIIMFTKLENNISKEAARKELKIPEKKFVFMVLGSLRNGEEKKLIETIASQLTDKEDLLYVAQWPFYGNRFIIKQFRQVVRKIKFPNASFIHAGAIPDNKIQVYLNACDVFISPRMDSLNSGLISLGFSFGKTVLGPDTGNMGCILKKSGNPSYNPDQIDSIRSVLTFAKNHSKANGGQENYKFAREHWSWHKTGQLHFKAYQDLLQ